MLMVQQNCRRPLSAMFLSDCIVCPAVLLKLAVMYHSQYEVNKFNASVCFCVQMPCQVHIWTLLTLPPPPKCPEDVKWGTCEYVNDPLCIVILPGSSVELGTHGH